MLNFWVKLYRSRNSNRPCVAGGFPAIAYLLHFFLSWYLGSAELGTLLPWIVWKLPVWDFAVPLSYAAFKKVFIQQMFPVCGESDLPPDTIWMNLCNYFKMKILIVILESFWIALFKCICYLDESTISLHLMHLYIKVE